MMISKLPTAPVYKWMSLVCGLIFIFIVWLWHGYQAVSVDSDLGRDLKEISNIQQGRVVWLGPWLNPGLPASSAYYYLFYSAVALSGGAIISMVQFNLLLALLAVAIFGYFAVQKYGEIGVFAMIFLGLLPVFERTIFHPGNGYSFVFFVVMCLVVLWYRLPLSLGSLFAGWAVALHPVTSFLGLFVVIEWWLRGRSWKSALLSVTAFCVPLAPLIAFEVITKGYIMRSFLAQPSAGGMGLAWSPENLTILQQLVGVPPLLFLTLLVIVVVAAIRSGQTKLRVWTAGTTGVILGVLFIHNIEWRYLLGVAALAGFMVMVVLLRRKVTQLVLIFLAALLVAVSPLHQPVTQAVRTPQELEKIADFIATENQNNLNKKLAVVGAMTHQTESPQADEYRFLLRNRGFEVVEVQDNAQADVLIYVIEVSDFDWATWSNWEIEQFGSKSLINVETVPTGWGKVTVVVFER